MVVVKAGRLTPQPLDPVKHTAEGWINSGTGCRPAPGAVARAINSAGDKVMLDQIEPVPT